MTKKHPVTESLKAATSLPLFVAPLFLNSTPELVLACVKEGLVPGLPAYGVWTTQAWEDWLTEIDTGIAKRTVCICSSRRDGAKRLSVLRICQSGDCDTRLV